MLRLHRLTKLLYLLAYFLLPLRAVSQKGFTVVHYTDDNGLPQNSVKSLAADGEGFIWMATENGLIRFDGQHFYNFDKTVLGIGTNRFLPFQPSFSVEDGTAGLKKQLGKRIYASVDFDQFVRIEHGVAKVDSLYFKNTIRKLPFFENSYDRTSFSVGLPSWLKLVGNPVHHIIGNNYGTGSFYVVDSSGIQFYEHNRIKYQVAFHGKWSNYFLKDQILYYLSEAGVLHKISAGGVEQIDIAGDLLGDNAKFSGLLIYWNIIADQAYFYWNKKLYNLEHRLNGQMYTKLVLENFDLEKQQIQSVYRDPKTQNLFLGSLSEGLYVLKKQHFESHVPPDDVVDNVFYAHAERNDQTLVMPNGITVKRDSSTGKVTFGSLPLLRKISPADKRSLFFDDHQLLWVKAWDYLYKMDQNGAKIIEKWHLGNEIKHIYQDTGKNIWIATATAGIYTIDPDTPNPQPVKRHPNAKATYFANQGKRVVAATTDGLYLFEAAGSKYQLIEATKGIFIKSLYVDEQGRVWMTANTEGLLLYHKNKLSRFPLDKNKYLASPHCLIADGRGFFWVSTDKGLFRVAIRDLLDYAGSPSPLFYEYHAKDEGFRTNEFNGGCQPCGIKMKSGMISFPSLNGLVWFDPANIPLHVPGKTIVIDQMLVNNHLIGILKDTIELPVNPVQTQFYLSTPYFGNPQNLNLSYALVGAGEAVEPSDWIPISGADLSIIFSNLNNGTHHLLIRKVNGFGKNNYTIRKIILIVPPLWYQTIWARILVVITLLLCVFLYNRFRIRKISQENAKLEELVARRTARLNDALSNIEESKNEMARQVHMLSRLLTSMTHDIQSPLNYIRFTSGSIPDLVENGDLVSVSEIGLLISDSSQRMGDLLRGLLDYIKVYVYGNSLQFQPVNLRDMVDNKFVIFKSSIEVNGSVFRNEVPEGQTVLSDEQMLAIMVHNLIDNAAKFTRNGEIHVFTEVTADQQVCLKIVNNGGGIGEDTLEFINSDPAKSMDMIRPYGRNTGIGLLIVKEIAEIIQVGLRVEQNGSTCFSLTFQNG